MELQDKGYKSIGIKVKSEEGEREPLSCNKANVRSPSLDYYFVPNEENLNAAFDILFNIAIKSHRESND